jgi:putative zinc finger protein
MSEVSMPPDATHPGPGHPDAAGWALGALDPADADAFEAHLPGCAGCQAAVAESQAVTHALKAPAPAVEPPPDLGAKVLASVRHASRTSRQASHPHAAQPTVAMPMPAQRPATAATAQQAVREATNPDATARPAAARTSRWWHWHWNFPVFSVAAACGAAAAAIVLVVVQQLGQAAPALVATFDLRPVTGNAAGTVVVHRGGNGWTLDASLRNLPPLQRHEYYECWYLRSPSDRPSDAITGGSFTSASSSGTFTMTSAANPRDYKIMEITIQRPGDSGRPGTVILRGAGQPA